MDAAASIRLRLSRGLEEGAWGANTAAASPLAHALSRAWGAVAARTLTRPLAWEGSLRTIAIGGATLGGSGKTPLAIACARALVAGGARVALVSHAYRARPGFARVVRPDDDVTRVGDEALVAARALDGVARVVVAQSRQAAVDCAAAFTDVVVLDGVLQTAPRRASLALLALDGENPWGAGALPPRGDLRAPRQALLGACDGIVALSAAAAARLAQLDGVRWPRHRTPLSLARVHSRGAIDPSGLLIPWSELARLRIGLFLALARPARLTASLLAHGVVPHRIVRVPDHGLPPHDLGAHFAGAAVDLWLASPKCSVHLEAAAIPHAVVEHTVELDHDLVRALIAAAS